MYLLFTLNFWWKFSVKTIGIRSGSKLLIILDLENISDPDPQRGKKPHLKVLVLLAIIIVIAFAVALRVEEAPAAALEESLRVVHNGLHDLCPVEGLDPFRVLDITRVQPFLNKIKIVWKHKSKMQMQMQNFANSDPDTKNTEIVRLKNLHMNL